MELKIKIVADDAVTTAGDLRRWLADEAELRGRVRTASGVGEAGDLGLPAEVLTVALGAGGAVTVLAASLRVWFAQPKRADVRLKLKALDGSTLEIDAKRVRNAEEIIRTALAAGATPVADTALPAGAAPAAIEAGERDAGR